MTKYELKEYLDTKEASYLEKLLWDDLHTIDFEKDPKENTAQQEQK
ncbi:MAG: hypothetical protein JST59_02330 [Actinobacteria bacterium]|nr:hypothetical protein [Actinomycetota bacterium]